MSRSKAILTALLPCAALLVFGGCGLFPWLVAQFAPPQKVKAVYDLPRGKRVMVLVEGQGTEFFKGELTRQINKQLLDHKLAGSVVEYERVQDAMDTLDKGNEKTPISTLCKKVQADQCLYVEVAQFSTRSESTGPLWIGKAKVNLKVIDETRRIWPQELFYPVPQVELSPVDNSSDYYGTAVTTAVAIRVADRVAKLFYEHELDRTAEGEMDSTLSQ